ncbi:MAG: 5'-nucleotidase [Saprospiraceae bacterium]
MRTYRVFTIIAVVLLMTTGACSRYYLPSSANMQQYRMTPSATDTVAIDNNYQRIIQPYKITLDSSMNQVIGHCKVHLTKRQPESSLGNWMADELLLATPQIAGKRVDMAIQNYGGIRIPDLAAGPITRGRMYELMPFDNTLVVMELKGELVQQLMNQIAKEGGWPISQGSRFTIRDGQAIAVIINEVPLDAQATYSIAMPDYIANGGSDCSFLQGLPYQNTGVFIRDILIAGVSRLQADNRSIEMPSMGRCMQ